MQPDTPQGDSLSVLPGVYALSGLIGLKSHSLGPRERGCHRTCHSRMALWPAPSGRWAQQGAGRRQNLTAEPANQHGGPQSHSYRTSCLSHKTSRVHPSSCQRAEGPTAGRKKIGTKSADDTKLATILACENGSRVTPNFHDGQDLGLATYRDLARVLQRRRRVPPNAAAD